ncbi:hypothetical protein MJO29_016905 [Puccinia striiformis f. sp. tritici]|nr:hypothetical protein MJO29_016905 [Puccinia striiformis f. sp. tritici]
MSAEGHSMVDDRRTLLLLNITIPHHANFSVKTSTSYHLQGEIIRLEDDGTIAFDVEHNPENQPIAGHELVDLGPVKVDGIGRISSVEFTHRTRGRSFWELQLDHEHRVSQYSQDQHSGINTLFIRAHGPMQSAFGTWSQWKTWTSRPIQTFAWVQGLVSSATLSHWDAMEQ